MMNDDFFEKFSEYNGDPNYNKPAAKDSYNYNPYASVPSAPAPQTVEPAADPVQPTAEPSVRPTAEPSVQPTAEPSVQPAAEQPVKPVETTPTSTSPSFAEMYRPRDAATTVRPTAHTGATSEDYTPVTVRSASTPDSSTDGYYYRSFTNPRHEEPVQTRKKTETKSSGISKGAIAVLVIICILVSGAAGFGGSILANSLKKDNSSAAAAQNPTESKDNTTETRAASASASSSVDKTTAEISEIAASSVVEITTEVVQTSDFYGQYIQEGAGSGVIIKSDGTIITNNHVIENAKNINVTLRSGESYEASVVGTDEELDIALIKIEADVELTVAKIGDSDTIKVGDKSVIIGNPLGTLGGSVTEGIVSALDRSIVIDGKTMNLLQTDAAINAGNSGGGMFNGQGELIGIVVAKNYSGEVDNIGFVIPINAANNILNDLVDYGYVRGKADTGMTFVDITNSLYAYYYFRSGSTGCYVASVDSGSNAESAGFKKGDRIVSIDDKEISESNDVKKAIADKSVGDVVEIVIERNGQTKTLSLTLEEKIPETAKN